MPMTADGSESAGTDRRMLLMRRQAVASLWVDEKGRMAFTGTMAGDMPFVPSLPWFWWLQAPCCGPYLRRQN